VNRACVLVEGMACRYKLLHDGSRQIVSIHMAGDIMDLHSAVLKVADHGIGALGHARVAYLPHEAVAAAVERHCGIARAFWRETLVDGSIYREWLLNVGRRDAYARLAHLFCEMMLRADAIGLSRGERFPFPLSQAELADATGLTAVHVNRTIQRLRADGLISTRHADITVEDWNGLAEAGSFDPAYLHLPR
jgi:CRP-like cAMP-binding protein